MENAIATHLNALKRLGKLERSELRDALSDTKNHDIFIEHVTQLIVNCSTTDETTLEDLFVLGVQIADVWPQKEIRLTFKTLSKSVLAFGAGFCGESFSYVFSQEGMDALNKEWPINLANAEENAHVNKVRSKPRRTKKSRLSRPVELHKLVPKAA